MVDFFLTIHWLSLSVLLSAAGQQLQHLHIQPGGSVINQGKKEN